MIRLPRYRQHVSGTVSWDRARVVDAISCFYRGVIREWHVTMLSFNNSDSDTTMLGWDVYRSWLFIRDTMGVKNIDRTVYY